MEIAASASTSVLRVCLDRFSLANGPADAYAEIVLDNSRGLRCEPLVTRKTAANLAGHTVDGAVSESTYHARGVYSHRFVCSESPTPAEDCSYVVAGAEGMHTYSASCDPSRSHCYSAPEYEMQQAQPLWCCDFDAALVSTAEYLRVEMWDEAQIEDDRLGNMTLAASVVLAKVRPAGGGGSASFTMTAALETTNSTTGGVLALWAGLVPATAASKLAASLERKKRPTQISYWQAFGPDDVKALDRHHAEVVAASTASRPRHDPRARRQMSARRMNEWKQWQSLPLLGAAEQTSEALAQRHAALSAATAAAAASNRDTCVVTTATGAKYNGSQSAGAALLRNKQQFCDACGYRCLLSTAGHHTTHRSPKWDKLVAIHDALRSCSIVLHVDADVVIRRAFQLAPLAGTWLSASRDYDGLNSGVLLLQRTRQARTLLNFAWRQTSFNNSFSAEQNALRLGLRRPYSASSRSRLALVSILEGLVEFPFYKSPLLSKLGRDLNRTAPLYHTAGCSANQGRVGSGMCDDMLLKQLPPGGIPGGACPAIEIPYVTRAKALLQHLQEQGSTNMGRRWLKGRDLRIKYTDQKGSRHDGWWANFPGCSEVGCDDQDARKRAEKAARKEARRNGPKL